MSEMKPCPFCGSAKVQQHKADDNHYSFVMCECCGASVCNSDSLPEKDCVDVWDSRAPDPRVARLVDALKKIETLHFCTSEQAHVNLATAHDIASAALAEYTGTEPGKEKS